MFDCMPEIRHTCKIASPATTVNEFLLFPAS
jgi:hypothetical protein